MARSLLLLDLVMGTVVHPVPIVVGSRLALSGARFVLGLGLVLHGLAQSVLPLRGAGFIESTWFGRGASSALWIGAMMALVGSGLGMHGLPFFRNRWRGLAVAGAILSSLGIAMRGDLDLAPGIVIDAITCAIAVFIPVHPPRAGIVRSLFGFAFFGYVAVAAMSHPFHRHWGAESSELAMALPGDYPNRNPAYEVNHAITIHATPEEIWPWIAQMGQDRGGFYSYDTLENVAGLRIHSADRIHPEWQSREVGDTVRAVPLGWLGTKSEIGWTLDVFEPNRAFGMKGWGTFVLVPQNDGTTRLIARGKMGDPKFPAWGAVLNFMLLDFPHFVMQQKQLRTIRDRVERRP